MRDTKRVFRNNDGDMLFLPQEREIRITTEFGILEIEPLEMALIPRGMTMQIDVVGGGEGPASGYLLENFGDQFIIPDLGVVGISSGFAHPRHFLRT